MARQTLLLHGSHPRVTPVFQWQGWRAPVSFLSISTSPPGRESLLSASNTQSKSPCLPAPPELFYPRRSSPQNRGSNQLERVVQYCCVATRRVRVYLLRNLHLKSLSVNFGSTEASSRRSCLLRTHTQSRARGQSSRVHSSRCANLLLAICYPLMPIMLAPSPSRHWW